MKYLFLLFLLLIPLSLAHLDAGQDVEFEEYIADFGYSPSTLNSGDEIIMLFSLIDKETKGPSEATDVWIRVSNADEVIFSGTLHLVEGTADSSLYLSFPGEYEIKARYLDDGDQLAEVDYTFTVTKTNNNRWIAILFVILGIILIAAGYITRKK